MASDHFLDDYSIEITAKDLGPLVDAVGVLPAGSAVSITFLPGNSVDQLVEVAAQVRRLGFEPVPHISARRIASHDALDHFLAGLASRAQARRAFVIAGDPNTPIGPFADALAVLESGLLQAHGIRKVGIAGYPEGHPAIAPDTIWRALGDKVAAARDGGLDLQIVTQFVFDPDIIAAWVAEVRTRGVSIPIRVGIPGPASVQALLRFAARCGVGASAKVMAKYGVSITRLLNTATPDLLIRQLADRLVAADEAGVKAHLYPFGGVEKTARWAGQFAPRERE
ncbi:methylenetetrahydrofolate reductase [Rhizorhabdus sp.]|uniref:methylenetetrahydrofolate reductase n=1 Tax=Rhizorhabdus sp. TaxID=1968843 RepID=UPI001985997B|nr:methylenetetrahydrofolate reductase [Rhizorhabdus sp.]MBD3760373.1 methylenetetrahydrofolate reductase [Rhizorhabdus sp.]